jgi:hypothetical protein
MKKGYIVSPVNGRLVVKHDKTFYIEYLPNDHVFVKDKFGAVKFHGFTRQMWLNKDLLDKFGWWLEPYIVGHERAHVYYYDWSHQKIQEEHKTNEYFDHEIFMEKQAIKYVKFYYEDDIYNKCLNFHIKRVDKLNQQREKYVNRN